MRLFEAALKALCEAEVEFVVIGGFAATLLGSRRATYEIMYPSRLADSLLCG